MITIYIMIIFQITDTGFRLIGPHQCDAEIHIDRKILSTTGDLNPGLEFESIFDLQCSPLKMNTLKVNNRLK